MSSESKLIRLKSSDGAIFEVPEAVASQSQTIKYLIEGDCAHDVIPVPNVTAKILVKVIEYLKFHVENEEDAKPKEDVKAFDSDFMEVGQETLYDLILAANYLNIKNLIDLGCQTVADTRGGTSLVF